MLIDLSALPEDRFEVELRPPEQFLEESRGRDHQAELRLMLTKRNRVAVRQPVVRPFTEPLDADSLAQLDLPGHDCDFVTVFTTVDCRPDPTCQFNWLRVEFSLKSDQGCWPVACRMFPERAEDHFKRVHAVEVGADLTIASLPGLSGNRSASIEAERIHYRVMTFGRFGSEPAWHFARTEVVPEVIGDIFLVLVVAVPAGAYATASLSVSAEAQLKNIPFAVPLITKRSGDRLRDLVFPLCPRER
ncbi:hypothetical protein ACFZDK_54380 [Streptomyces sp. NPDC007901]|uniref:hypothetical protein n=1 Tax=Streptomyces sp. NPDC007901 TaxID=3364785 RepID=UPI0036E66DC1